MISTIPIFDRFVTQETKTLKRFSNDAIVEKTFPELLVVAQTF